MEHEGVLVVRDDLFPGRTKARFLGMMFDGAEEVVYASPAEGGAQVALATVARRPSKRTREPSKRPSLVQRSWASLRVTCLSFRRVPANRTGARLMPFGADMPEAISAIAAAARAIGIKPDELWCAAGSGVPARGLAAAWPYARRHAVQVGRTLTERDVAGAIIHVHPVPFGREARSKPPPFPSDPEYEAKAWEVTMARKGTGRVVFWNVTGAAA
jgi:hypothetical protein